MWFEQLLGFRETDWSTTRDAFFLAGNVLVASNGRSFDIGRFSTPSLGALGRAAREHGRVGDHRVSHHAIGDVLELHARPDKRSALFQVASQFNCLEFMGPEVVPEDGVTRYTGDSTQGPACALAAGAATVYRNHLVPVENHADLPLDDADATLVALGEELGTNLATTTDRRGFGVYRLAAGEPFEIVP